MDESHTLVPLAFLLLNTVDQYEDPMEAAEKDGSKLVMLPSGLLVQHRAAVNVGAPMPFMVKEMTSFCRVVFPSLSWP